MNERTFSPADAHKLEDPTRPQWLPPDEIIRNLSLKSGMIIADIGAGTGYFSLPMAKAIGDDGKVYAVDVQEEMLALLRTKLTDQGGPASVIPVHGEAERTGLPRDSCDLVFMSNVWHELDNYPGVLREMSRILRPGGTFAILDYRAELQPPPGPPQEHRVSRKNVVEVLGKNSWSARSATDVGRFSYLVLATRP